MRRGHSRSAKPLDGLVDPLSRTNNPPNHPDALVDFLGVSPGSPLLACGRGIVFSGPIPRRPLRPIKVHGRRGLVLRRLSPEDEGSKAARRVKLSDLGLDIAMPGSPRRDAALQTAALKPPIHRELREQFAEGASPNSVRFHLTRDREFTEKAADELIREYQATMKFAGLGDSDPGATDSDDADTVEDNDLVEDDFDASQDDALTETQTHERERLTDPTLRTVTIPMAGTAWVKLQGEFPMSQQAWDQFIATLGALKSGLTDPADD